jgi:hypothetical protein
MAEFSASEEGEDIAEEMETSEDVPEKTEKELKEEKEREKRAEDPHYPEYYLKQIPKTDEEKAIATGKGWTLA